jgi:hypothetical protein
MRLNIPQLRNAQKNPLSKFAPPALPTVKAEPALFRAETYFTVPDGQTHLLYTAQSWVKVRLLLESAGPVVYGQNQGITPVLSGRGSRLITGEEKEIELTKGSRIFIAAEAINRVSFSVSPIPFSDVIGGWVSALLGAITGRK